MSILCNIKKNMGRFKLDIFFEAGAETVALMGASGSGKSMTLRCIAGIETPDEGEIIINGVVVFNSKKKINLPPQKRKIGYLFQDYALFPNMTVSKNILAVLPKNRWNELPDVLERFQLSTQKDHYPKELSGGQKQRCALARMMVTQPEIILLDEPFSALDSYLRWQMEQEVRTTIARTGKTSLFVSHDRDEVYRVSDRVVIVHNGKSEPIVEKHLLYRHPKTYVDALLTGCKNICSVTIENDTVVAPMFGIKTSFSKLANSKTYVEGRKPESIGFLGIRSKKIQSNTLCEIAEKVVLPYEEISVTEGIFTYIMMIKPEGGDGMLRWEMSKEVYEKVRGENHQKYIAIPFEDIMLLQKN